MSDKGDRRSIRGFLDRLGVKRAALLTIGFAWMGEALSIIDGSSDAAVQADPNLLHLSFPLWVRVAIWGGSGLVVLLCVPLYRRIVGGVAWFSAAAWFFAVLPLAERAASFWGGWITSLLTDGGVEGAWVQALKLTAYAAGFVALAAIREAPPGYIERRRAPR